MALKRFILLLMAFLLVFASNAYSANATCDWGGTSALSSCRVYSPETAKASYYYDSSNQHLYRCLASNNSYLREVGCSKTCPSGSLMDVQAGACVSPVVDSCPSGDSSGSTTDGKCYSCNGVACDTPPDDCSTLIMQGGRDLSGSTTDGQCGCPSSSPDFVGTAAVGTCQPSCASTETRNSAGVCIPTVTCPGNLALVNGSCGCPAGQVQGTFNGVPTCASNTTTNPIAPVAGVTQGGGTIVGSTGQTSTTTPNGDGTFTTTTTINNTTVINGAAPGSGPGAGVPGGGGVGTATISNGTTTVSVVTDSTGKVISSTSTGTEQKSNDSLTLPGVEPAHAALDTTGISGAIMNSPIVSAFTAAFGRFPTVGGCSTIVIPLFAGMVVEFKEQCHSFEAIRAYLTMFAMVVYGLLSYRVFMRSASGV